MAPAGPYASLHCAPDRQPRQHPTNHITPDVHCHKQTDTTGCYHCCWHWQNANDNAFSCTLYFLYRHCTDRGYPCWNGYGTAYFRIITTLWFFCSSWHEIDLGLLCKPNRHVNNSSTTIFLTFQLIKIITKKSIEEWFTKSENVFSHVGSSAWNAWSRLVVDHADFGRLKISVL